MLNHLLFVYGSLLDDDNDFAVYLKNQSRFYAYGKLKGTLYDIGEYPGAVPGGAEDSYIYGAILEMNDAGKVLPVIDDYEGYGANQSYPNEFVRVLADVGTDDTIITCWVYLYNLPVTGLILIKDGRYIK